MTPEEMAATCPPEIVDRVGRMLADILRRHEAELAEREQVEHEEAS